MVLLIEAEAVKFISVFEAIRDFVPDATFSFFKDRIFVNEIGKARISGIVMSIDATYFDKYIVDKGYQIGISMEKLHKGIEGTSTGKMSFGYDEKERKVMIMFIGRRKDVLRLSAIRTEAEDRIARHCNLAKAELYLDDLKSCMKKIVAMTEKDVGVKFSLYGNGFKVSPDSMDETSSIDSYFEKGSEGLLNFESGEVKDEKENHFTIVSAEELKDVIASASHLTDKIRIYFGEKMPFRVDALTPSIGKIFWFIAPRIPREEVYKGD